MMKRVSTVFSPRWAGVAVGALVASMASFGWSQVLPPVPAPPVPDAVNTAQGAVQDATNTAQGAVNTAQDTVQGTANTAQNAAQGAANAAQNTAQGAANTAQETTRGAANTAQGAAKGAANTAQEAAQDTARGAANTAQGAARGAANTAQGAARGAANTAQGTVRGAAGTAQDAQRNIQETTRDLRQTTRDAAQGARNVAGSTVRNLNNLRSADLGIWFDRSAQNGLIVADVATNAALGRFGFIEGDRIVSVAGQPIANEAAFVRYLLNPTVRGPMNVIVMRDGQQQTLVVDPMLLQQQLTTVNVDPLENFGIILDDRFNDRLVVWRVIPRSPAFYAGIRAGDVITTFSGQPVATADALVQIAQQTQPGLIPIQVTRNGRARMIEVDTAMAQRTTTARQDLDANANIRTNETYINSDVNAGVRTGDQGATVQGQADANAIVPADTAPVLQPTTRPAPTYRYAPRRGLFRWRY